MEKKSEQQGIGLSNGFLLGVVVGVIITLLVTTQRGKRILKLITEEGMSKLSDWENVVTDMVDVYEAKPKESEELPVALSEDDLEEIEKEELQAEEEIRQVEIKNVAKKEIIKPSKRFFKGIHKRSINLL